MLLTVGLPFLGCAVKESTLSVCEETTLKEVLCGLPARDGDCAPERFDDRELCERQCLIEAPCADFATGWDTLSRYEVSRRTWDCVERCRRTTSARDFECEDGQSIPDPKVCDGVPDCATGEDEAGC